MDAAQIVLYLVLVWVAKWFLQCLYNIYFHPLSGFPGPTIAASTGLYKTWIDCVSRGSFVRTLERLHEQYGEVVRAGPNELHFSNPETYLEIYNNNNRWDKEKSLYHSFGEDRSSFGYLSFQEAKERRDIVGRTFSKKAVRGSEGLVLENVYEPFSSLAANAYRTAGNEPLPLIPAHEGRDRGLVLRLSLHVYGCHHVSVVCLRAEYVYADRNKPCALASRLMQSMRRDMLHPLLLQWMHRLQCLLGSSTLPGTRT